MNKLDKLFRKKAIGMEITIRPDGEFYYQAIVLERKKEGIEIKDTIETDNLLSLKDTLDKNLPLVLSLNGKGIISREISNAQLNDQEIIRTLLPGASANDFYLSRRNLSNGGAWATIVRRETLDKAVKEILKEGFFISEVFIGPVVRDALVNLVGNEIVKTSQYLYTYQANQLNGIQINTGEVEDIRVGEDVVQGQFIPSFSLAFSYLLGLEGGDVKTPDTELSNSELWHKNVFYYGGITALIVFFSILLVNFFLFDHYRDKLSMLQGSAELNKSEYQKLTELEAKVKEKSTFIESTGLDGGSKTSFYADRIASTVPKSISLKVLDLNPLGSKVKGGEQILFKQRSIVVDGLCVKSTELNEWIKSLKGFDWVKGVELRDYKGANSSGGEFKLEIELL